MKGALRGLCRPIAGMALGLCVTQSVLGADRPPQQFLVVMAAVPAPRSDPQGYRVFVSAMHRVIDLLFKPNAHSLGGPWYLFGTDTLTMIESGPGPKPAEDQSAAKGHWNLIDFDYARPITRPWIKLRQSRFEQLLFPRSRNHELDLDLVLGASFRSWAPTAALSPPIHLVVMSAPTMHPDTIPAAVRTHYQTLERRYRIGVTHRDRFNYSPTMSFWVETADLVINPDTSLTQIPPRVKHRHSVLPIVGKLLEGLALLSAGAWISRWVWFQRKRARHFELWIPGFARAFPLPSLCGASESRFRARLPRYTGEPALHLQLPSRTIRSLFLSRAVLRWDSRLRVEGTEASVSELPIGRLPRFVRFLWVERPVEEGNLNVSIERPRMLGSNDQISIAVSFLALPPSEP